MITIFFLMGSSGCVTPPLFTSKWWQSILHVMSLNKLAGRYLNPIFSAINVPFAAGEMAAREFFFF